MFPHHFRLSRIAALAIVAAASGCSGASHVVPASDYASARSIPTTGPAIGAAPQRSTTADSIKRGWATIHFRLAVPGRAPSNEPHRILPHYVSASTAKVVAVVRGLDQKKASKQSFACTAVCTGSIVAPVGADLVTLRLEDVSNNLLSQGSGTVLVFAGQHNLINFTLDGVPESVSIVPVPNTLPVAPASTGYVIFQALDADGNLITPDGDYTDAAGQTLAFDIASSNPSLQLDVATVSAPGTLIPFNYDGTQHVGTVTLTPSAHPGVTTSVTFAPGSITLVPGIAMRIPPPQPIQVLSVTQVPFAANAAENPSSFFVLGNAGGAPVALAYDTVQGAYGIALDTSVGGVFAYAPVDWGAGSGFFGWINFGNDLYGIEEQGPYFGGVTSGGDGNPCVGLSQAAPIGEDAARTLYCQNDGFPGNVYDDTHSMVVAYGQVRLIRTIGSTDYFVTDWPTGYGDPALNDGQNVFAAGSTVPISGALCVGASITSLSTGYYGNANGTVSAIGGSTIATFSHPIQSVVGYSSSIYAYESDSIFGVFGPSGTFESTTLPIGAVVDVATGVNGAPMLVESDGTLDVMAI